MPGIKRTLCEAFGAKTMASCAVCGGGYQPDDLPICPRCFADVARECIRHCRRCGKLPHECKCSGASVRSVMWYKGAVRGMMHKFKHHTDVLLTDFIAAMSAEMLTSQGVSARVDAVVPIPSRKRDVHFKGYGHAEVLARAIADKLGLPYVEALGRTGARQQKLLSASQRKRAIARNFEAVPGRMTRPDGTEYGRILLVDDITTSGATMTGCAAMLRRAGARQVVCFTPAKTPGRRYRY